MITGLPSELAEADRDRVAIDDDLDSVDSGTAEHLEPARDVAGRVHCELLGGRSHRPMGGVAVFADHRPSARAVMTTITITETAVW